MKKRKLLLAATIFIALYFFAEPIGNFLGEIGKTLGNNYIESLRGL